MSKKELILEHKTNTIKLADTEGMDTDQYVNIEVSMENGPSYRYTFINESGETDVPVIFEFGREVFDVFGPTYEERRDAFLDGLGFTGNLDPSKCVMILSKAQIMNAVDESEIDEVLAAVEEEEKKLCQE